MFESLTGNKKILFVVHRYAPFPGGSEYYVQQMAEEALARGHDVSVFAGEHKGNLNGVKVSNKFQNEKYDLIIIHGGDVGVQNWFLQHAHELISPVLYMLIKPSESVICLEALNNVDYIGYSTTEDWNHLMKHSATDKSWEIKHGISMKDCTGQKGIFKHRFGIPKDKKMFLSCGGYWANKKMKELADAFRKANLKDAVLVTTGYDNRSNLMPVASENVIPLMLEDAQDVKNAIADADCYIMNSNEEGFGLVILESMLNRTPWISRNIAGAKLLNIFGETYNNDNELITLLKNFKRNEKQVHRAYNYVIGNHLISNTVNDIEKILRD